MNERIKEFAKQTLSKDQFGLWLAGDEDIEKFVELIVNECTDRMMQDDLSDFRPVLTIAGFRVKKHFGIKNDT
jgi:phosphate uptake regulator